MARVAAEAEPGDAGLLPAGLVRVAGLPEAEELPGAAVAPEALADVAALLPAAFQVPLDEAHAGARLAGPSDVADHPGPRQLREHPDAAACLEALHRGEPELPAGVAPRAEEAPDELASPQGEFQAASPDEEAGLVATAWAVEPPEGHLAVTFRAAFPDAVVAFLRESIAAVFPGELLAALARDAEAPQRRAQVLGAEHQLAEPRRPGSESASEPPLQGLQLARWPPPRLRPWPFPPASHRSGCHGGH